ncbi:MAG: putative Ig domain-containing protein, partial [Chloroflexi bacterium]|nr:putative Ig domain-containing protein [Chloroflexota bacterium]
LRPSPTFQNLAVKYPERPPIAHLGQQYSASARVSGGTPSYYFAVSSGVLPPGLILDSFTGAIEGVPTATGSYTFNVLTEDTGGRSLTSGPLTISIRP